METTIRGERMNKKDEYNLYFRLNSDVYHLFKAYNLPVSIYKVNALNDNLLEKYAITDTGKHEGGEEN